VNDHGSLLLVDEKEVKVVEVEREMMTRGWKRERVKKKEEEVFEELREELRRKRGLVILEGKRACDRDCGC